MKHKRFKLELDIKVTWDENLLDTETDVRLLHPLTSGFKYQTMSRILTVEDFRIIESKDEQ